MINYVLDKSQSIRDITQFPLPIEKGAEINVEIDNEKIILRRVSQI